MKETYSPLEPLTGTDAHGEDDESVDSLLPSQRRRQQKSWSKGRTIVVLVLLLISNVVSGLAGGYFGQKFVNLDKRCASHTVQYSPVVKDVDIKYEFQDFNGTFMQETVYRRPGNPETDAAWEALGVDYRAGVIPVSEGLKSGLTTSHVQRATSYHGGGFFVNVEGLHHLHCLNLVRKSAYYNYQYYKDLGTHAFMNEEPILQLHVSHCIDIIRQVLMCNVDTGVLGQVWALGSDPSSPPSAFPDFNTRHKCKNYDAIREWAEKMQEPPPETLPDDYMLAPGPGDVLPSTP